MSASTKLRNVLRAIEDAMGALRRARNSANDDGQSQIRRAMSELDDAERYIKRAISEIPDV